MKSTHFYPVILAGGRGTRFWPMSRKKNAKQLLALDGKQTMIQQTVRRLLPLAAPSKCWIITNADLQAGVIKQLPRIPAAQVIAEPAGRNTAPAIGLAAFILFRKDPQAVLGLFPSDQVVEDEKQYQHNIQRAVEIAAAGENIVTLGINPNRPETGYGYIEATDPVEDGERVTFKPGDDVLRVRRFTEKPDAQTAQQFVDSGNFYWNSGMFIWSAATLVNAISEHLPETAKLLEKIAAAYGTRNFDSTFKRLYPKCENISVDYGILEPRSKKGERASNLFCIPSEFGWNDLGSWTALYEHRVARSQNVGDGANVIDSDSLTYAFNAEGNYVHAPGKFVAVVGVKDLVVVETADAILITSRKHSQDVGKVVKHLDEKKLTKLV